MNKPEHPIKGQVDDLVDLVYHIVQRGNSGDRILVPRVTVLGRAHAEALVARAMSLPAKETVQLTKAHILTGRLLRRFVWGRHNIDEYHYIWDYDFGVHEGQPF